MAALSRRLQTRGSCLHRPQQPPSLHGYEKFELQTNPLGRRALSLPFAHQLSIGQGQWSCRCSIAIPSAKCQKSYLLDQKHQDPAPAAVLLGQRFWSFLRRSSSLPPDPCLRHCCSASVAAVLGLFLKQNSQWGPLQCQYWSHEAKTPRLAKQQQSGKETAGCRPSWRMGRHQGSAPV